MEYRTLGRSGCAVSTLALGTMTFGDETDEVGRDAGEVRMPCPGAGLGVGNDPAPPGHGLIPKILGETFTA